MKPFLTLHHPARAKAYYEAGFWADETFYDLLVANAERLPDQIALRDGRTSLSWEEVRKRTDVLAASFAAKGLSGGDRVAIWMSNRVEAIITFLACSRAGLACNPSLHRTYTSVEIIALLSRLKARALVSEPGWGADSNDQTVAGMVNRVGDLKDVYVPDDFAALEAASLPEPASDPDAVVYLAFTSGTTGDPKCVMHSANTLLANARDMVRDWGLTADARLLSLSPLSHHIAWVGVSQWLVAGCQLITDDAPAETSRLDWIIETGATYVMGVPTHAMDVLAEQGRRGLSRMGAVEVFYMAGSPIPPVVAEAFVKQGIKPQNVYGMTETSSHQYTHPGDEAEVWIKTTGRGGPAYEIAILDPDNPDLVLARGETGEIAGRGAALMLGYYGNQDATQDSFNRDGWFRSGDLGSIDAEGNLRVEGRLKDLIIRGGHNIYPAQIEALALRHDGIEKAAAFPVEDDRLGERVCLGIIGTPDAEEVVQYLAAQGLSRYDMPEYFLSVDEMPLTPSGKILKRELAAMVKRGQLDPEPVRYKPKKENA